MAIMARPSVHSIRSDGTASASAVGLDSGRISGRSTCPAMSRTMSSVNDPGCPDVPISTVGCTLRTMSASM